MTLAELGAIWDRASHWYDRAVRVLEWLLFRRLRRRLLARAGGRVLEVGAGTGVNLPFYPAGADVTAVDLSPGMLAKASQSRRRVVMDAAALGFRDGTFDTVVSTLATCTFPDPVQALREMARVCRTDGRILLLEHGRSTWPGLARFQDRTAPAHARQLGCWWNREPLAAVEGAGLTVVSSSRSAFGMVHCLELTTGIARAQTRPDSSAS